MKAGREIKFRALGVDGDLHYFDIYDIVSPPDEDGVFYVRSNLGIPIAVEEGTEQQFTGLRDKNGKEIYEGDILRVRPRLVENLDAFTAPVIWKVCGFELDRLLERWIGYPIVYGLNGMANELEIIGNIYENPELLEVGK